MGTGVDFPGEAVVSEGKGCAVLSSGGLPLGLLVHQGSSCQPAASLCSQCCWVGRDGEAGESKRTTKPMSAKPDPSRLHPAPCKAPWPLLKFIYQIQQIPFRSPAHPHKILQVRGNTFWSSYIGHCPLRVCMPCPCSALQPPGAGPSPL